MGKTIKKIWNCITTVLVILAVLLAVALAGVRLAGLHVFTVLSGSMEPEYPVGSLIYVKKVDYTQLEPGDVITFMLSEDTIATHRITDVLIDEEDPTVRRFFTKGDANPQPDAVSVHYKNIIGSPVMVIPKLGYFANYIQNPPGIYVAISVGAIILMLMFIPDLLFSDGDKKKDAKKTKGEPEPKTDPEPRDEAQAVKTAPESPEPENP